MKTKIRFGEKVDAEIVSNNNLLNHIHDRLKVSSVWDWEHWRDGKLIDIWTDHNLATDEGLDSVLDVYFSDATQITDWYILLFEDDHTPAAGDDYAIPGFTESTAYAEANRPAWQEAGPSTQQITNSANKASFTMNATKTIYGAALVGGGTDADTKDDQAGGGTLYCEAQFTSGSKAVEDTDVLKVTITISAAAAA